MGKSNFASMARAKIDAFSLKLASHRETEKLRNGASSSISDKLALAIQGLILGPNELQEATDIAFCSSALTIGGHMRNVSNICSGSSNFLRLEQPLSR